MRAAFRFFLKDPLRTQFFAASALFALLFWLYAWQGIARTRGEVLDELHYLNRLFAESTRASFIVQESRLLMLGEQLRRSGGVRDAETGRLLLEEMARIDPGMAGFGLARADGQLVVFSGAREGEQLPNLLQMPETRDSFEQALRTQRLTVGRPYFQKTLGQWVIPLRVTLPESDGQVRWVMTAGLRMDGGNTPWARMQLPPDVGLMLFRSDGYVQYASPLSSGQLPPEALRGSYGRQIPDAELREVTSLGTADGGDGLVTRPALGGALIVSVISMPEYGLTAVAGTAERSMYQRALAALVLPAGLLLVYLAAAWGAYTLARRGQLRHEQRLVHLAHHDPLTSLPNRALVMDRLRQALAVSVRQDRSAALLFADLDNFKHINDTYGHKFGDELIRTMARIFGECVRPGDTVARLGGDEFLVVLPDLTDDTDAKRVAERIQQRFNEPIVIDGQTIHTSASLGIAVGPRDASEPEELLRLADIALYDAKGRGRKCFSFFDSRLNQIAYRRTEVEKHLRRALDRDELSVVYQPIFRVGEQARMSGAEALVRWTSPELGAVAPDEFIRVAEEAGLISAIGTFVLERAAGDLAALVREFGRDIKLSVNVSAWEFRAGKVAESVRAVLERSALAPRNLMLEVTEGVMIEDFANVKAQLLDIRKQGASVAIDDFGTGWSSLSYLTRLPVSTLKIDRFFVRDLCSVNDHRTMVRSVVAMAHEMDMIVVAEGVETAEQLESLCSIGCDLLQGYYFSPPVSLEKLRAMLEKERVPSA